MTSSRRKILRWCSSQERREEASNGASKAEGEGITTPPPSAEGTPEMEHRSTVSNNKSSFELRTPKSKIGLDHGYKATQSTGFVFQSWKIGLLFQTGLYLLRL